MKYKDLKYNYRECKKSCMVQHTFVKDRQTGKIQCHKDDKWSILSRDPDAGRFWAIIEKYKVTKFYTAPTAIRSLMRFGDEYVTK
jgi:hypothetical protein